MLVDALGLDDHVVYIHFNILPNLVLKDLVHESLVRGTSVFQSERHYLVAIVGVFSNECCFFLVGGGVHANLVVPRIGVEEAEEVEA